MASITLIQANARELPLPDDSVHMAIGSPPYWRLREYEGSYQRSIWGGDPACRHDWEWYQDKGQSGGPSAKQLSNAGSWYSPADFANCKLCGAWFGSYGREPTADMYIEHTVQIARSIKRVLRPDGTLWVNIGDKYINGVLSGVPWKAAYALVDDGWILVRDVIWSKINPMPENVLKRPVTSHEYIFMFAKSMDYYYDWFGVREDNQTKYQESWGNFRRNKVAGKYADTEMDKENFDVYRHSGRHRRSVWSTNIRGYAGGHYATYPPELVQTPIMASTSDHGVCAGCGNPWVRVVKKAGRFQRRWGRGNADGSPYEDQSSDQFLYEHDHWEAGCDCGLPVVPATVLDPFAGAGTTGIVARKMGRDSVLVDISEVYLVEDSMERLEVGALSDWSAGNAKQAEDSDWAGTLFEDQYKGD